MILWRSFLISGLMLLILTACQTISFNDIVKGIEKSIVLISYGDKKGHGTGFFVKAEGQCAVLTAAHVVRSSEQIKITPHLDKKLFNAANIEPIPGKDLAVITFRVDGEENCPYTALKLNKSHQIEISDPVLMVGYPTREGEARLVLQFPKGEVTRIENPPLPEGYAISYDMTTVGGMSGAPVVNEKGEVIAVHGKTDVEIVSLGRNQQSSLSIEQKATIDNIAQRLGRINHFKWGIAIESYLGYIESQSSSRTGFILSFPSTPVKLFFFIFGGSCLIFVIVFIVSRFNRISFTVQVKPNPTPEEFRFETKTVKVENDRFQGLTARYETAKQFKETLPHGVVLEMVEIPDGRFLMGGTENESEKPQHQVRVPTYYMGKYLITQAQWFEIAQAKHLKVNVDLNPDPSKFKGLNHPVENVNWYDCVEFCQRLSKLTERNYKLPSEAQWEYACRAGTTTPFSCGETITTDLANYNGDDTYASGPEGEYREQTTPVGQFPANGFGLYDMHGNVWEWCADDWHDNYQGAPNDGTARLEYDLVYLAKNRQKTSHSMLRGGSCSFPPNFCRSAYRYYDFLGREHLGFDTFGFRVVCVFGRNL